MNTLQRTTLAITAPLATALLLAGCGGSEENPDNPTTPGTITSDVSTGPATSPATTTAPVDTPATTAPATGGSQSPTTELSPGGPSQTVSGGNSATPPPVQSSPSPPTGDNLPGENAGPQGQPGEPGRN